MVEEEKKELLSVLREDIQNGCKGFYLCYQPLIRAEDGEIIGAEALLRWGKAPYGDVMPGTFIPLLEKDTCFYKLCRWILRQAMADGKAFLEHDRNFIINVNISSGQMEQADFADMLMGLLSEADFPAENLCLELTEREEIDNITALRKVIAILREQGIKIAIDDFGTGIASLHLLRELEVDHLKIDRMFIQNVMENQTDQAIVKAVVECAKQLGIRVCLEGIENKEIKDFVKCFDADMHQGYYYGKPVLQQTFLKLL